MSDSKPAILITGATGNIGKELVKYLSSKGEIFRAMVRSAGKAAEIAELPGAEIGEGNFDDPASLQNALSGIQKAFLLTNSSENAEAQQLRFVEAARLAGVQHIVKLSQWAADVHSPVRFLRYHAMVENAIRDSGMAYTFLRPNLFMQGLLGFRETIISNGQFFGAIGDAKISAIDIRDIAAVAGETLTGTFHENKIYNLTGREALSHQQFAEKLSTALGHEVRFVDVPGDALRQMLVHAGFPAWQADGLVEDYAHYKRGEAAEVSPDVEKVTGHSPLDFDVFAKDYAQFFRA